MNTLGIVNLVKTAKEECDVLLGKYKDIRQAKKESPGSLQDFILGSKFGLDYCLTFECLERYEEFILFFSAFEENILKSIKTELSMQSLEKEVKIDKKKLKLLNTIKGTRCSIEYVYKVLLKERGELEGDFPDGNIL